jgi:ATPase subunit of ABC transporter with duplicated ATPase domains
VTTPIVVSDLSFAWPDGARVLDGLDLVISGGHIGAGKTTLLRTITGELPPRSGTVRLAVPARLLPQRLDILDSTRTVADNAARFAPHAATNAIRAGLARLLFPGSRADQVVGTLSGGELFRATLAALLLAEPALSCSCWTSPLTTLTWPACAVSPRLCTATAARC